MAMLSGIDLHLLTQGEQIVETYQGATRRGRITKINYKELHVNSRTYEYPISLEMNNEASDWISWDQISNIRSASYQGHGNG